MSRFVFCVTCGVLLVVFLANFTVSAVEFQITTDPAVQFNAETFQSVNAGAFENHRLELGHLNSNPLFTYGEDGPSPLFTGSSDGSPSASDWNYLWRNASRIPITSIPEPTAGSFLIGGAILLCLRRMRNINR